jgi:hypothetical protein
MNSVGFTFDSFTIQMLFSANVKYSFANSNIFGTFTLALNIKHNLKGLYEEN